jgi:pyruvate-ferredoxin/flavodoxin oxidoreductase
MKPMEPLEKTESVNWDFFMGLPDTPIVSSQVKFDTVKNIQVLRPLFEFSGACAGCGETPYLKLLSQLFGDRALIANATGCSSIYGGNLPTTPWAKNAEGRGPAWSNSLFEDNAEFGLGFRLAMDQHERYAKTLIKAMHERVGPALADEILNADQSSEDKIVLQRQRVEELKKKLQGGSDPVSKDLFAVADALVKKSVWLVGGDGWAYDIGFGGLDHVMAGGANVNILVLDTEVYSNTGGQASKSTSRGAVAKFAAGGKETAKKDLGLMAMSYGNVYVAQIAMGGSDSQTVKAFLEAESYDGPSLIIAYSHCIAHGIDMQKGIEHQKKAVDSGYWPIYRYDPRLTAKGQNPFQLDCRQPSISLRDYMYTEARFRILYQSDKETADRLLASAEQDKQAKWSRYNKMVEGVYA